ncbi:MAG: hypothetical protein HQL07_04225 [Nitrospirae bacterium]|nr:hypothetical protein [Magnetococcales bacterium]HAT51256.1 hypothetical protein [Alphaproteobacteria bacterium]
MNTAERIYTEVKRMPEEQAYQVLEFIEAVKKQSAIPGRSLPERIYRMSPEELEKKALAAQTGFPRMDQEKLAKDFADMRDEWDRMP